MSQTWECAFNVYKTENAASIYLFRVTNGNTRTCEISPMLTIKTPHNDVNYIVQYLYCKLWKDSTHFSGVSHVDFEQINVGWEKRVEL